MTKKLLVSFAAVIMCIQAATVWSQDLDRTAQLEARRELASIGIQFNVASLIDAVKNRDSLALSLLLEAGMDVNTPIDGQTALIVAVQSDAHEVISLLLEAGADIAFADRQGNTALHAARDAEAIDLLVEKGVNVNVQNDAGETALWRSVVKYQNRTLAKAFLDAGATPDLTPVNEATELAYAVERQDAGLVRILSEHGATLDVSARNWSGEPNPSYGTPTYWEGSLLAKAVYDDDTATANVLLDFGASPNSIAWHRDRETRRAQPAKIYKFTHSSKSTPFMLAVQRGRPALAARMLTAGANANAIFQDRFVFPDGEVQSDSYSPLSKAVRTGNAEVVALLLEHGADANAIPCVLHRSAYLAHPNVLRHLIEAGADVDEICPTWNKGTALHTAIQSPPSGKHAFDAWTTHELKARREIVEALINAGADVNKSGWSLLPIHSAVRGYFGSDARNLELLVAAGANVNAQFNDETPLRIAVEINGTTHNRVAKVQVLIDSCVDLEAEDSTGQTALEIARYWSTNYDEYHEVYDLLRGANTRQRQLGCE